MNKISTHINKNNHSINVFLHPDINIVEFNEKIISLLLEESENIKMPIYWSTNDFEEQAKQNFSELKKDNPIEFKHLENWEQLYDKSKFPQELEKMIKNHDATIGISWLTVEEYIGNCEIKK